MVAATASNSAFPTLYTKIFFLAELVADSVGRIDQHHRGPGCAQVLAIVFQLQGMNASRVEVGEVGEFDAKPGTGIAVLIDVEDAIGVMHQSEELGEVVEEKI